MKRHLGVVVVVFVFALAAAVNGAASRTDFRQTSWGMSKDKVKAAEKGALEEETADLLIFADSIGEYHCYIHYWFAAGRLYKGMYQIIGNDYLADYEAFKELMSEKYGPAADDVVLWRGLPPAEDNPEGRELAVRLGQLVYSAKWRTDTTDINLLLCGEEYAIKLLITYESRSYNAFFDQEDLAEVKEYL